MVGKGKMRPADIIILVCLILLTVLSFRTKGPGESILITADGKEYIYPAGEDRDIAVEGPLGTTFIRIVNGEARITDSPCPNKTCMTRSVGNTITCLPNRVMIENPSGNREREVDTVAY